MALKRCSWILAMVTALVFMPAGALAQAGRPSAEPTEVEVAIVVLDLERIDDAMQGFSANVLFVAQWIDPRLAHDGPGVESLALGDVWNPRLQIVNVRKVVTTLPTTVVVASDGTVTYRQRVLGEFSQKLGLADFPLDRQRLAIQVVATGYSQDEIAFTTYSRFPSGIVPDLSISDWEILGSRAMADVFQPMAGVPAIASYFFEIDVRRMFGYYLYKIILPLFLIVAMSWLVFWIDADLAGPQISIAVTSMLTLIAYRFMVSGMLPRIPYLTRMDYFTSGSTILIFLTLVVATMTVMITKRGRLDRAQAMDRYSRVIFPLAFIVLSMWSFWP